MNHHTRRSILIGFALLLSSTAAVAPAFGDQIQSISGDYDDIRPPTGTLLPTFTFTGPGFRGAALFTPSTLAGLTASELEVDLSSMMMTIGSTVTGPIDLSPPTHTIHIFGSGSEEAIFTLANAQLTADTLLLTATVTADAFYVSDSFGGAADLSLFSSGGQFVADLTGIQFSTDGTQGQASWSRSPQPHATFTITPGVPEPAWPGLWSLPVLAWMAWRLRRRLAAR
jgi:hypothetical protein